MPDPADKQEKILKWCRGAGYPTRSPFTPFGRYALFDPTSKNTPAALTAGMV